MNELRDMAEADIPALDALLRSAYNEPNSLEHRLRAAFASGAARTVVVDDGGALVGMAILHDYDALGYVALVGVAPERRREGIARRLMEAIVDESRLRGHTALALEASADGKALYDALEFTELGITLVCEGPKPAASPRDSRVRDATAADFDVICAYDAVAFGGDRSSTLRQYFADDARHVVIADDGERIGGYAVAHHGGIGPLLAQTPGAAAALADAACEFVETATVKMYVPEDNRAALALAAQRGWKPRTRLTHMALGNPFYFPRRAVYGLMSAGEG